MADNVWLQSKYQPWEKDLIDYFRANGKWDKVIWTSNENPDKTHVDYNNMTSIPNYKYTPVPLHIYDAIYPHLYQFCDLYSRTAADGSQLMYDGKNIHDYKDIFNILVSYYYNELHSNRISLVLLFAAPHVGRDFVLYHMARIMGIRTMIAEQSYQPNKFFYYFDQHDYGTWATAKQLNEYEHKSIENKFEKNLLYMKEYLKTRDKKITPAQKINKYVEQRKHFLKEFKNKSKRNFAYLNFRNRLEFLKNAEEIQEKDFSLDVPFVYFPLHLQPEKTTSSWGGKYNDQALAIEHLSQVLPAGWKIYVKENPKQTNYFMRGKWFYKRLKAIDNVVVVESKTDTYALLRNCQFVATITGTVGWEAITGGKNALIFGWGVWYKNLPGVFKFDENFRVEDIMNYKFEHAELEKKFSEMLTKMGTGVIYKGSYKKLVEGYTEEQNLKNITQSFDRILY